MATFKTVKPADAHVVTLSVVGSKRVSPHVVRVTLGGDDMELFTPMGFDQWFRLFLARDDQDSLRLPTRSSGLWYVQYLATPKARRPWVRNYTVRAARFGQSRDVLSQDAYGRGPIKRKVSTFRGRVESGNSGGPVVDGRGRVMTTVFASAVGSVRVAISSRTPGGCGRRGAW